LGEKEKYDKWRANRATRGGGGGEPPMRVRRGKKMGPLETRDCLRKKGPIRKKPAKHVCP